MENIYTRLQQKLNDFSTGFPATESKVEIRILKQLFSEADAELFLELTQMLHLPDDVAKQLGRDKDEVAEQMEQMAKKGLLFRIRKGDLVRYAAVPYVVGIFEFQINNLNPTLAQDMEEYFQTAFGKTIQASKTPVMRTIPVNRGIVTKWPVSPYEDVVNILENQKKIAVAPCICRKTAKLTNRECDKPQENCMMFGSHADYYVENGMGRYITAEEAKQIARQSEEAGLVMQPFNSQKIGGMCSCCGDCCGVLRSLKMQPKPAQSVQSNYFAVVDEDSCIGCEVCLDRCQMDAIAMIDEIAVINLDKCIGCGLCVTTCSEEALRLEKKPEDQLYVPPKNGVETYINIAMERGII
jgi:electron transport complex protein RnfB